MNKIDVKIKTVNIRSNKTTNGKTKQSEVRLGKANYSKTDFR